jgi:hypothetical protein
MVPLSIVNEAEERWKEKEKKATQSEEERTKRKQR